MTLSDKIETLRALYESDRKAGYLAKGYKPEIMFDSCTATIKEGKKYAKLDCGSSGRLMITMDTGDIYGIKAYGVIHKGHHYGNLDTINEYFWGEYYPVKKVTK